MSTYLFTFRASQRAADADAGRDRARAGRRAAARMAGLPAAAVRRPRCCAWSQPLPSRSVPPPEVLGIDDRRGRAESHYHETWQRDN